MGYSKIGINGFGRIGFCTLRLCVELGLPVVAINASRTAEDLAYIFKYDSVHGRFPGEVYGNGDELVIEFNNSRHTIRLSHERDPEKIPWKELGVEYVIECTGKFLTQETASAHLRAGAKKVILSAPAKDDTPMFVMGVNEASYDPEKHHVVSNASCTTNCLAPLAKVIHDNFGIESGLMTTVHAVTSKQQAVDNFYAKDFGIGRTLFNIIPSTTGAAKAVGKIIPELNGKLTGISMRVPVADVSIVDLTVNLKTSTTYDEICRVIKETSEGYMFGIVDYIDKPLVSSDFIGNVIPCNFDARAGVMITPTFVKLCAWYDNEMSYTYQMLHLYQYMSSF